MNDADLEMLQNEVVGQIMDTENYDGHACQTTWSYVVKGEAVYHHFCLTKDETGNCEQELERLFEEYARQMEANGFRALGRSDVPPLPDEHCLARVGLWFSRA